MLSQGNRPGQELRLPVTQWATAGARAPVRAWGCAMAPRRPGRRRVTAAPASWSSWLRRCAARWTQPEAPRPSGHSASVALRPRGTSVLRPERSLGTAPFFPPARDAERWLPGGGGACARRRPAALGQRRCGHGGRHARSPGGARRPGPSALRVGVREAARPAGAFATPAWHGGRLQRWAERLRGDQASDPAGGAPRAGPGLPPRGSRVAQRCSRPPGARCGAAAPPRRAWRGRLGAPRARGEPGGLPPRAHRAGPRGPHGPQRGADQPGRSGRGHRPGGSAGAGRGRGGTRRLMRRHVPAAW
jgi:hypothetical protein